MNKNLKMYEIFIRSSVPENSYHNTVLGFTKKDAVWKFMEDPKLHQFTEDMLDSYVHEITIGEVMKGDI